MHDLEHERNINKATADAHRLHHLRSLFLLQYIVDPCDFQEMKLKKILIVISTNHELYRYLGNLLEKAAQTPVLHTLPAPAASISRLRLHVLTSTS